MAVAKQVVKGKIVKKEWFQIKSTKAFDSTVLGEGYVPSPDVLLGRHLTANLANLTGDIRQQGINLKFRIDAVEDSSGIASVIGYEASPAQLRRLVRRGVERLDDSIYCTTSDGRTVMVKPFAVTKTSTSKYKLTLMRRLLKKMLPEEVAKHDFDNLVRLVISNKLQADMKAKAKKLFPMKAFEIRRMQLLDSGDVKTEEGAVSGGDAEQEKKAKEEKAKKEGKKNRAKGSAAKRKTGEETQEN